MLAYMQSKRKKLTINSGIKQYPEYKGPPPPPNRFGIKPGYRWDGVDRSTGFEKRLFEGCVYALVYLSKKIYIHVELVIFQD